VLAACHESDPKKFGTLMRQSHASLRDDFEVSTETLDDLVAYLDQQPEVFGARMTGAGFGGACVALVAGGTAALVASRVTRRGFTVLIPQL
jgi:galactokinase